MEYPVRDLIEFDSFDQSQGDLGLGFVWYSLKLRIRVRVRL